MEFKYLGCLKPDEMVYFNKQGYFVAIGYDNLRKATRKELRKIRARFGHLEDRVLNENREVLDIEYYIDNGYKVDDNIRNKEVENE